MFFDVKAYVRFIRLFFFRSWRDVPFRMTPFRVCVFAACVFLFTVFELLTAVCMLLDNVFFPGYRRIRVDTPLFIVGPHRSGTTYLQQLIARDESQFFCFKTWEIVFPSILQKKFLAWCGRIDRKLGGRLEARIRQREARTLGAFRATRRSLFEPVEEDKLFVHTFSMPWLLWFLHPDGDLLGAVTFDEHGTESDRARTMRFYLACIKRQAYFAGGDRRFLSKAPVSCFRIRSLYRYFPGCRMIYTIRNPLEGVPSMLDTGRSAGRAVGAFDNWNVYQGQFYEVIREMYRYPLTQFERADERTYALVVHDDLLHDLDRTIRSVYEKLGYALSPAFAAVLAEQDAKQRRFRSPHEYSLAEFGLDPERIRKDFGFVFERFSFDSRRAPAEAPGHGSN
jgi:hypothetical protein